MSYIALFRGINVGGHRKVEMKKLTVVFESLGCTEVSTYINSGNVFFETDTPREEMVEKLVAACEKEFGFAPQILIKTAAEMRKIAWAILEEWVNDDVQRTDVAYLFPEVDRESIIDELPIKRVYADVRYVKGAVFWNIKRADYNKSHLGKLISHKLYQQMTVRNINTARRLSI